MEISIHELRTILNRVVARRECSLYFGCNSHIANTSPITVLDSTVVPISFNCLFLARWFEEGFFSFCHFRQRPED